MALAVALFAALVVGFIAFSAGFGRAFLTAPILFMVAGALVGRIEAFAAIDHARHPDHRRGHPGPPALPRRVAAATARAAGRRAAHRTTPTGRTAPDDRAPGTCSPAVLFPGIGVWLALLLAAALAPTDAGLGAATVLNPVVPVRVRRVLNVESGLNDGLATPVVLFAVAAAAGTSTARPRTRARGAAGDRRRRRRRGRGRLPERTPARRRPRPGLVAAGPGAGGGARRPAAVVLRRPRRRAATGSSPPSSPGRCSRSPRSTSTGCTPPRADRPGRHTARVRRLDALRDRARHTTSGRSRACPPSRFALLSLTVLRMVPVALCLLGSGLRATERALHRLVRAARPGLGGVRTDRARGARRRPGATRPSASSPPPWC